MGGNAYTTKEQRAQLERMAAGKRRAARERATAARRQLREDLAAARQQLRRAGTEADRTDRAATRAWQAFEPYDGMPGYQQRAVYTRMVAATDAAHRAAMAHLACYDRVQRLEAQVAAQKHQAAPPGADLHIDQEVAA